MLLTLLGAAPPQAQAQPVGYSKAIWSFPNPMGAVKSSRWVQRPCLVTHSYYAENYANQIRPRNFFVSINTFTEAVNWTALPPNISEVKAIDISYDGSTVAFAAGNRGLYGAILNPDCSINQVFTYYGQHTGLDFRSVAFDRAGNLHFVTRHQVGTTGKYRVFRRNANGSLEQVIKTDGNGVFDGESFLVSTPDAYAMAVVEYPGTVWYYVSNGTLTNAWASATPGSFNWRIRDVVTSPDAWQIYAADTNGIPGRLGRDIGEYRAYSFNAGPTRTFSSGSNPTAIAVTQRQRLIAVGANTRTAGDGVYVSSLDNPFQYRIHTGGPVQKQGLAWGPNLGKLFMVAEQPNANGTKTWTLSVAYLGVRTTLDWDKDFKTDIGLYNKNALPGFPAATWYFLRSSNGTPVAFQYGAPAFEVPLHADFDGDGTPDRAVWRPSTAKFKIYFSSGGYREQVLGNRNDYPFAADFTGDGRAELGVFRPANGVWYIRSIWDGFAQDRQFGAANQVDFPVPADYDGDSIADLAVWRRTDGNWYIGLSSGGGRVENFGRTGLLNDVPTTGDFDGDGRSDLAIANIGNAAGAVWSIRFSRGGTATFPFGAGNRTHLPIYGASNYLLYRNLVQ